MLEDSIQNNLKFLKSALAKESHIHTVDYIVQWIQVRNSEVQSKILQIPLDQLKHWNIDKRTGSISHNSGKFFSIEGVSVETNFGLNTSWDQPIINQPEIGFLGFLTKQIDGVLHFLMQAKIEPGNLNVVQLAPTLQATKSNYTRIHKGKTPLYLEYFNGEKKNEILIDQLQSEQGARFLRKRNRNIIIEVDDKEDVPLHDGFIWVTLGQLKQLMSYDNVVNMDTRTVISSISFGRLENKSAGQLFQNRDKHSLYSMLSGEDSYFSLGQIISWITNLKFRYELNVGSKDIKKLRQWLFDGNTIFHETKKYFTVIGVDVQIGNREVINWDQPMIKPAQEGIIAFIIKKINGVYHFLVQAKVEAGNFDILELAPTVQCLTGNYRTGFNEYNVPFINEVLEARPGNIWHKSYQSEEGGRFYQEQNLNMMVEAKHDFSEEIPENYCWMTLSQLNTFMRFNNYLNIASRSLISLISV
jgi:dTDP-4-dehydro-6-deoxy-alpha-D-glucopyranose 2,3-dehydratase